MKLPLLTAWLICFALLGFAPALVAQSGGEQGGQAGATPPRTMSPPIQVLLTGCLKRSNDGGYRLTDSNGKTWQLSSKSVELSEHLNHSVTVTGKPAAISKEEAAKNTDGNPSPALQVLTVKMLSNSCTR